jgi:N-acetylglucosaminyldiphosphoundecaprenol N-acetyl-beta-D-mannosaminyltransferase
MASKHDRAQAHETYDVIGTRVAATSLSKLSQIVRSWRGDQRVHVVCFADANSLILGRDNPAMRLALDGADVVSPDGMPLAVVGRVLRGVKVKKTSGPDFIEHFAWASARDGTRHFFLGGKPGVAQSLASGLASRYKGLIVAGAYSPPKFPLTDTQNREILDAIRAARPDVVWVGLGAPKQEIWMNENRAALSNLTMLGVGAAFDFSTGAVKRAPRWMQMVGLEWAFRLVSEPRRLAMRYGRVVPRFLGLVVRDLLLPRAG